MVGIYQNAVLESAPFPFTFVRNTKRTTMAKNIKIHIADDHQILIDGLEAVLTLEDDIEIVGHSLNGNEVLEWFDKNSADVLIMDINMPEKDGITVLKAFNEKSLPCPIIVLSSYDYIKLIREVLKLGASGYLAKKCAGDNIVEAIRAVHSGEQYFSHSIREKIVESFSGLKKAKEKPQEGMLLSALSDREREILKFICNEYSSREIAEQLCISPNTVETHRKNLLKKLQVKSSIGLALFAAKNKMI